MKLQLVGVGAAGRCVALGAMNFELHELQPLEIAVFQVKEVLKILMHSIIFQRALGEYGFRDTESELFEVTYVRCNSRLIDLKVEEHAEEFSKAFERHQWGEEKGHVQVRPFPLKCLPRGDEIGRASCRERV